MKISTPTISLTDRGRSIKKQLQCNNKLFLHGAFKDRQKFIAPFLDTVIKPGTCMFPKPSKIGHKSFTITLL